MANVLLSTFISRTIGQFTFDSKNDREKKANKQTNMSKIMNKMRNVDWFFLIVVVEMRDTILIKHIVLERFLSVDMAEIC